MKKSNKIIELELKEMASLIGEGCKICPKCGTLHPLPEWAAIKNQCPECKSWKFSKKEFKRSLEL